MKTGDLLAAALGEIKARGWCRGNRHEEDGRVCALGAFEAVYGINSWEDLEGNSWYGPYRILNRPDVRQAIQVLIDVIPEPPPRSWKIDDEKWDVADYNNSRQSVTEIEEWFEKAIAQEGVSQL